MSAALGQLDYRSLYKRAPVLALEIALVALAYFALARASLYFASINPSATPIWPPTGVALAIVLMRGNVLLPAILVGAFAANLANTGAVAVSTLIALGNTLEAFVGAHLLARFAGGRSAFQSAAGIAKFAAIVSGAAAPVSATIGVTTLCLFGEASWSNYLPVWTTWWLGDVAGAVLTAPALVLWTDALRGARSFKVQTEAVGVAVSAVAVGLVAFSPLFQASSIGRSALAFLAIIPLLWAALRLGPKNTALVALLMSGFAIWGVSAGASPFSQETLNDSFLLLIAFIVSTTLPSLALSAAVSTRDATASKQAQDHRLLIDSVRDYAIFMLDAEGRVTSWNAGAERIKQYAPSEILGRHFSTFFSQEDREANEPEKALAHAAKADRFESEGWRVRRDGSRFWAGSVLSAIRDAQGRLIGYAKVTRDLTERRESQIALDKADRQLAQSQKLEALGQLTGGVAHDFNNLLMAISGGLRLLEKRPDQRDKVMEQMHQSLDRGVGLTRRLLSFARREPLQAEVIDVAATLASLESLLEQSAGKSARVEFYIADGIWPIDVDRSQFELAILNLALNARDAMQSNGILSISAENAVVDGRDVVRVSVRDTGTGMTADVLAHAFEPFFSTKAKGSGTGLGLAQVYGFAKQSGGGAAIDSVPGHGTTVTITLPRATRPLAQPASPSRSAPGLAARILVVEDNYDVAVSVCDMIEEIGHSATHVADAKQALAALEAGPFDLVFSDILMPGSMNGVDLAAEIQRRKPGLPVVLTTGYAGGAEVGEGMPVLRKPYRTQDLDAAFAAALKPTSSLST